MKSFLMIVAFLCASCFAVVAQRTEWQPNWLKIDNAQYGFVVGSNGKDSLYFITVTASKLSRNDRQIDVVFPEEKGNGKALLITDFDFADRNLALYLYIGHAARKANKKHYDDFIPTANQKLLMVREGQADDERKTRPYIPSHQAVYQETVSTKDGVYYFDKTGGSLERGMILLNEKKAVVGIVADDHGSKQDRFSVISISAIASRLAHADRNLCRYFNLIKMGESMTTCEKEEERKKQERIARLKAETERKNRTREEQRVVRRNSDYWFSFGPMASANLYLLKNSENEDDKVISSGGYTLGMNIYANPNPGAKLAVSIRPCYSFAKFTMPESMSIGSASQLLLKNLIIQSYEMPIIMETPGNAGLYLGLGYVPAYIKQMSYSYQLAGEETVWKNKIVGHARYLHRLHAELGVQSMNLRVALAYQYQFGSFVNRNYEMIIENEVIKPFSGFDKRFNSVNLSLSLRLWGRWH